MQRLNGQSLNSLTIINDGNNIINAALIIINAGPLITIQRHENQLSGAEFNLNSSNNFIFIKQIITHFLVFDNI